MLVINILVNQAPEVDLLEPYAGQRVMEGDSIRASATVNDDMDVDSELVLSWRVYDMAGNTVLQGGNEPVFNITDLTAGFYIVEATVVDTYGEQATASMDFEYTLWTPITIGRLRVHPTRGLTRTPENHVARTSTTRTTITMVSATRRMPSRLTLALKSTPMAIRNLMCLTVPKATRVG